MPSPIVENMLERTGLPTVTADTVTEFLNSGPSAVLFFCEDPKRYPESNDVAMALPEILKEYQGMVGGLVEQSFEHELQKQFDFTVWPALAFFKSGHYLGAITGIQNWDDYLNQINALLEKHNATSIPAVNL